MESNGTGPHNLSFAAPALNDSISLGMGGTADFGLASFSALYWQSPAVSLELALVSVGRPGLNLSLALHLDFNGDGGYEATVLFRNLTTRGADSMEAVQCAVERIEGELGDFRAGAMRLLINRTDQNVAELRILCGNGANSSLLKLPYGGPLHADAGGDRSAHTNRTVAFNASRSRTVDPASTQYLWDFGDGTGESGVVVEKSYNRSGTYEAVLRLGWREAEATDIIQVIVTDNLPPTADAGWNTTRRVGELITFNGSGNDPDGTIVSYEWLFGDEGFNRNQNATHAYDKTGNYTVILTVTDDDGLTGTDAIIVRIRQEPLLTGSSQSQSGRRVTFEVLANATAGGILSYRWDFGDGANATGYSVTHLYGRPGDFLAVCNVSDEYRNYILVPFNVTINYTALKILSMGPSAGEVGVDEAVHFNPSVETGEPGNLSYYWTFGDGTSSSLRDPDHSYGKAGTYKVTLQVSDSLSTSSASIEVVVKEKFLPDTAAFVCLGLAVALGLVAILFLVRMVMRRPQEGYAPPPYAPPYGTPPQGGPPATGPPPATPEPTDRIPSAPRLPSGAPYRPEIPGPATRTPAPEARTPEEAELAAPAPERTRAVRRAAGAPPGACPRCGSKDLSVFPDGHAKCNSCKKVFFTG